MTLSGRSFYGPLLKWSLHTWVNLYKDNWLGDVRVCVCVGGGGSNHSMSRNTFSDFSVNLTSWNLPHWTRSLLKNQRMKNTILKLFFGISYYVQFI